jgi:hypothetical protein
LSIIPQGKKGENKLPVLARRVEKTPGGAYTEKKTAPPLTGAD